MKLRALVFEDNEAICSMLASIFKERGYEVFKFSEAGSCPFFLKQDCPCPLKYVCADILITDVHMPGISGLDFIENQLNHGCKAKNIGVMSGSWTKHLIEQAKKLNVHIFKKPFKIDDFFHWLNDCEKNIDSKRKLSNWWLSS